MDSKNHISTDGTTGWSNRMIWRPALERCDIAFRVQDNGEEHNAERYQTLLVNTPKEAVGGRTCRSWGSACWRERWTSKRDCWRKSDSGHMKESCKYRKWAPSRISFVKISAGLIRPGTWRICKEDSYTHSRTALSLISMWWICFVVILWDQWTQDLLLL